MWCAPYQWSHLDLTAWTHHNEQRRGAQYLSRLSSSPMLSFGKMQCNTDVCHIKEAIWIRRNASNTMNWDEGPNLSHVYDPLPTMPTSGVCWNRRLDKVLSFWWSKLLKSIWNCQSWVNYFFFLFWKKKKTFKYDFKPNFMISFKKI